LLEAEAELRQPPGWQRLDDQVRGGRQVEQQRTARRGIGIQRQALLAGIHVAVEKTGIVGARTSGKRSNAPRGITTGGFETDHFRAQVGKQLAAVDARGIGDFENPTPAQRRLLHGVHSCDR